MYHFSRYPTTTSSSSSSTTPIETLWWARPEPSDFARIWLIFSWDCLHEELSRKPSLFCSLKKLPENKNKDEKLGFKKILYQKALKSVFVDAKSSIFQFQLFKCFAIERAWHVFSSCTSSHTICLLFAYFSKENYFIKIFFFIVAI